ncbi:MAG: hypothetical protein IPL53_18890 [Ignavibacteria bacterium]|nr:hypothetical protein [Ignavibacteria bacterium]
MLFFFWQQTYGEFIIAKHLYQDNPEYSFAHKLNYYGNELRKQDFTLKGNIILIFAYIFSPKYISKREKIKKSNVVYVSNIIETKSKTSLNPSRLLQSSISSLRQIRSETGNIGTHFKNTKEIFKYRIQSAYHYFKYRKFKAKSKLLYAQAIENYNNKKRLDTILSLIPSYLLYPVSIFNRNKMSLMINSLLGDSFKKKIKTTVKK